MAILFSLRISVSLMLAATCMASAQSTAWMPDITQQQTYTLHRATSKQLTGGNVDSRVLNPGETRAVLDVDGPGSISHIWFTISSPEPYHLKRMVIRMYWDNESEPSVEAPIGDFFGLGTGDYVSWQSELLSVGNSRAMNCFFPMPYAKHARITLTNEGKMAASAVYYNIEYRTNSNALPPHTLYFHAQYRQASPNAGWTGAWYANSDPLVIYKRNETGNDN